ncbi:MAG: 2-hydroxyacid dehydrogenase [Bacteroidota bacterium]
MDNKKILLSRIFPQEGTEILKRAGFTVTEQKSDEPLSHEDLIEQAQQHHVLYCTLSDKIDNHFIQSCSHLEHIAQFAVGYDNIDVAEATKLKIPVSYTPGAMTEATADIAFGLMIATARKMFFQHKNIIRGNWKSFYPTANLGIELKGKTLGIFGMGRIGMAMAERCRNAYNMRILYVSRKAKPEAEAKFGAEKVDFETLLKESDVISPHTALTEETKGLFDKAAFSKMKSSALFINTARGQVHNEEDLIEAIKTGQIWGAGLDVTNPEPMRPDNPLLAMENVTVLPHIGSGTIEARTEMSRMAARNIIDFYQKGTIPNPVNPGVLKEISF